jgi:hypothetical protein
VGTQSTSVVPGHPDHPACCSDCPVAVTAHHDGMQTNQARTSTDWDVAALLEPVDISAALEERAAKLADVRPRTDGDAYGRTAHLYPVLSETSTRILVGAHQRRRELEAALAAGVFVGGQVPKARRQITLYRDCTDWLLGSLFRLIQKASHEGAKKRLGDRWARRVADEIISEGYACALDVLDTYPGDKPGVANYVAARVKSHCEEWARNTARSGTVDRSWDRATRVVSGVLAEAQLNGELLDRAALEVRVWDRMVAHTESNFTADERTLVGDARDAAIRHRLSKSGMLGAYNNLGFIVQLASGEMSLQTIVGEDATEIGDLLASSADTAEIALDGDSEDALERLYRVALGDAGPEAREALSARFEVLGDVEGFTDFEDGPSNKWSLDRIEQAFEIEPSSMKSLTKQAVERLRHPHATFAHCAPDALVRFAAATPAMPVALADLLAATA